MNKAQYQTQNLNEDKNKLNYISIVNKEISTEDTYTSNLNLDDEQTLIYEINDILKYANDKLIGNQLNNRSFHLNKKRFKIVKEIQDFLLNKMVNIQKEHDQEKLKELQNESNESQLKTNQ